jgi:hypothetical protein
MRPLPLKINLLNKEKARVAGESLSPPPFGCYISTTRFAIHDRA